MQTTPVPRNVLGRFAHVDALRAFAVLLVVANHAGVHVVPGGSGVTIFFAISGFVITRLVLRERARTGGFDIGRFYVRRLRKLAPPFLVAILLPALIAAGFVPIDWGVLLAQLLFAYNWLAAFQIGHPLPWTIVLWSLAIEEQFYIVFAALWLFLVRARHAVQTLAVVSVSVILVVNLERLLLALLVPASTGRIYNGTDSRADAIAVGVLAAVVLESAASRAWARRATALLERDATLVIAVVVYLVSLLVRDPLFRDTLRYALQALAGGALILWGFGVRQSPVRQAVLRLATLRPVQVIGLASYSVYLAHLGVILALRPLLARLPAVAAVPLLILLGTAVGVVLYYVVEVPVASAARRRDVARTPTHAPAEARPADG